jgi:hypothetical protein
MSCKPTNHTSEEIKNIFINKGMLFDIRPDDTVEDIVARYKYIQDNVILPPGEDQRYSMKGFQIKERVSNAFSKKAYERQKVGGKAAVAKESSKPDNIKYKHVGIKIHQVLADIANSLYNNVGDISTIRKNASTGEYALNENNFNSLVGLVREYIKEINKTQNSIDPSKKATILIEQKGVDPIHNIGGTQDILAIFSDKRQSVFDYKVIHSYSQNYANGQLIDDLMGLNKINNYSLNMTEYVRINREVFGLGEAIQIRLVPIHIRLEMKPREQWGDYDQRSTKIELLQAGSKTSNYLKPIPLVGEHTKYAGVDALLEKQWRLLSKVTSERYARGTSATDKERLKRQISVLTKAIRNTIVDGDISDIITSAGMVVKEFNSRITEQEFLEDSTKNPKYLSDRELEDLISELNTYGDIVENTHRYYGDLKESDPTNYEKLRKEIFIISGEVNEALVKAKVQSEERIYNLASYESQYKDEHGKPLPLEELDFITKSQTRFSEIPHPAFKVAWDMLSKGFYHQRQDIRKVVDDINEKEDALFKWAKTHNMDRLAALYLLVNPTTGHLANKISKELYDKTQKAYANLNVDEAYAELSKIFEIRDIEEYKKKYAERFETYRDTQVHKYEQGEGDPDFKKDVANWINQFDLVNSKLAWANSFNRGYLEYKQDVKEANYSEEYKRIMKERPLLDYYEMYTKYNKLFRVMMDIAQYSDLPENFVANIRKTMVDHLSMDKLNVVLATKEFFESFQVRQEDDYIGDVDESGNMKRNIPIFFLQPFLNKDGEIDHTKKSYDLSKNLVIFAKMAYNWKYMHEIEPKIMQMRAMMATPTSEIPGTKVTDSLGRTLRGAIKGIATKAGIETDTYKLFEELTDAYLYGIKFKDNNMKNSKFNVTKLILKLKQYYGKSTLAFAVIPGLGAFIAGTTSSFFEASKGISFTRKNWLDAHHNLVSDFKKYAALPLFFDVYAEDPTTVLIENKSANFWSKIMTYRNMMYPLRRADELMNNNFCNAMALNWGIDTEGILGVKNKLYRLNQPGVKTTGIKNIWDLTTIDKKSGKITIHGLTDDTDLDRQMNTYIAYRNAVKSTSANIIGSLSQEDLSRNETNLLQNVVMQFKSWMPGIVRERSGKLIYDDKIQAARWGRYRAAFSEFGLVDSDFETGFQLRQYVTKVFLPNVAKLTLDLMTFGLSPKIGLTGETYTDLDGKERKVRTNIARARRMYNQYMLDHKALMGKMTFDMFLEVKEAQMKTALTEMRTILGLFILIHLLGSGGGDDKKQPPYMANWFSRFMYKNMTKAQSELTFMWSPQQFAQLVRNPIPMTGLLTRAMSTISNGLDETRDMLEGENSLSDKTPAGYYTIQWIYGGGQIARLLELYKTFEKSPYASNAMRR